MHTRKVLITSVSIAFVVFFILYTAIEFRGLFLGPRINLYSPEDGTTVTSPIVNIDGISERTKELTINGNQTLIDTEGHFSVNLVLSPGYNIITIVATDSRDHHRVLTRHLYYERESFIKEIPEEVVASSTLSDTSSSSVATTSDTQ